MSHWQSLQIADKIRSLLRDFSQHQPHHFGAPFVTAYQLAIAFTERFPEAAQAIGQPIGGAGTGQHTSLAQYLARELSQRIKSDELDDIEGGFVHSRYMTHLAFSWHGETHEASNPAAGFDISVFRLKKAGE
jgi:hypothetical protein